MVCMLMVHITVTTCIRLPTWCPYALQYCCIAEVVLSTLVDMRRVPDELKKHSLSDGVGGQYSTNLDRNRYGADDQYLSTVIRYDLEYLRLCPCLVDVEIIDAKNGSGTILVSAGPEYCLCNRDAAQARHPLTCSRRLSLQSSFLQESKLVLSCVQERWRSHDSQLSLSGPWSVHIWLFD